MTADLLRGRGRFTADIERNGAAVAVFLRSPHPHAVIEAIDSTAAVAMPGVIAVLTAETLGFAAGFSAIAAHPLLPSGALRAPPRSPIAQDRVRHVGEIVALVLAETRAQAEDAAEAVMVDYAPLEAVAPLSAEGPDLHDGLAGNLAMDATLGDRAAVEAAFAQAAHVAEAVVTLPRLVANPMEPRSVLAAWDGAADAFDLWTPHQGAPEIQRPLAAVLGVAPAAIRVHAGHVGGAFGARGAAYPEHAVLMAAARQTGRTVFWQGTRMEGFQSDVQGRGNRLTGRLALDEAGRFTAIDVRFEADLGAWATPVGAHINVKNPAPGVTGCYAIPAATLRIVQRYSNAVPSGPYRGAGRPDIACLVERLVEVAAAKTGMDRLDLRRRNAVPAGPAWQTPLGARYADCDFAGLLDEAIRLADWAGFPARREASRSKGMLRGIGVGLFVEIAGGGAWPRDQVGLRLSSQGGALRCALTVLGQSTGQDHAAALAQLVAETLGCAMADVDVVVDRGAGGLEGSGAYASRGLTTMGSAAVDAARRARDLVLAAASEMLGAGAERLRIDDGRIAVDGQDSLALADAVSTATQGHGAIDVIGETGPVETFPSGCHVAEVELDPETGAVRVVAYTGIDDCGRVIDTAAAHGQLVGGIMQGVGEALCEAARYDADGQLISASFMDYAMPRADMMPEPLVIFRGLPSRTNPTGAKGAGEAGVAGALTAIVNAVHDAASFMAPETTSLPFTAACLSCCAGESALARD